MSENEPLQRGGWVKLINIFTRKLKRRLLNRKLSGVRVFLNESRPYAVLMITPIMRRVHQLQSTSDVVFVETCAPPDITQAVVTLMLVGSKAGCVPVAAMIHEHKTQARFTSSTSFDVLFHHEKLGAEWLAALVEHSATMQTADCPVFDAHRHPVYSGTIE